MLNTRTRKYQAISKQWTCTFGVGHAYYFKTNMAKKGMFDRKCILHVIETGLLQII